MSDGTEATKLAQDLDAALAAYQRHFGRPRTMAKLEQMLAARKEAQRIADTATEQADTPIARAAE